jgi:hypothetical protein
MTSPLPASCPRLSATRRAASAAAWLLVSYSTQPTSAASQPERAKISRCCVSVRRRSSMAVMRRSHCRPSSKSCSAGMCGYSLHNRSTVMRRLDRSEYIDPNTGKITLRDFGEKWIAAQPFDESSRQTVQSRLYTAINPALGKHDLRALKPSTIQAFIRGLQAKGREPSYVRVVTGILSSLLGAAVDDEVIRRILAGHLRYGFRKSYAATSCRGPSNAYSLWPRHFRSSMQQLLMSAMALAFGKVRSLAWRLKTSISSGRSCM